MAGPRSPRVPLPLVLEAVARPDRDGGVDKFRGGGSERAAQQADAADEGRLEASGSIMLGPVIVNQSKVVRPSQLIRGVGQLLEA